MGRRDVRVSQVEPARSVVTEHAPHLAEHVHQVRDVQLWRRLEAEAAAPRAALEAEVATAWRAHALPLVRSYPPSARGFGRREHILSTAALLAAPVMRAR